MSDRRRRLEWAEEEVRKLLAEVPTRSYADLDREERRRHLLVLERLLRKVLALAEVLEKSGQPSPWAVH